MVDHLRENPIVIEPDKSVSRIVFLINPNADVSARVGASGGSKAVALIPHDIGVYPLKVF